MKKTRKNINQAGITLVALVVTIVVIIVLAVVSINLVLGDNGIIRKAELSRDFQANAEAKDSELMEQLLDEIDEYIEKPLVETLTEIQEKTVKAKDSLGNKITVPAGFKVLTSEGTRVQDGIVIQDEDKNEFVWVPVSNVNGDGEKDGVSRDVLPCWNKCQVHTYESSYLLP